MDTHQTPARRARIIAAGALVALATGVLYSPGPALAGSDYPPGTNVERSEFAPGPGATGEVIWGGSGSEAIDTPPGPGIIAV